jgi:hypothetical protein
MYFVPEGQHDRSQARSAFRGPCPRRGYRTQPRVSTLGTQTNGSPGRGERGGYQMKLAPIALQKSEYAIGTCYNWTIGPRFRLVRTFDLAPPSGRVALGGRFSGLKPWAEYWSPVGAQKPHPRDNSPPWSRHISASSPARSQIARSASDRRWRRKLHPLHSWLGHWPGRQK